MPDTPEPLELTSHNLTADRLADLLRLFPEIGTEGGKIDFDRLKLALGESVDVGKERYGMNWPGKAECFKTIQAPSLGTLLPVPEESVNFDTTENMIIEGDNLEVLKLLQKSYMGKVKMIYIDPPYNTGKDFIYPDNYSESLQTYLEYTGQVDAQGRKFGTNTDAEGRFHSKWMNMIYPRLYLARNLLRDDGVVFVSIDNSELINLRRICDEVFGEENCLTVIANVNNPKGRSDDKYFATAHEYILAYARQRDKAVLGGFDLEEKVTKRYRKRDSSGLLYREMDLRKTGDEDRRSDREDMFYYFFFDAKTMELRVSKSTEIRSGETVVVPLRDDATDGRWRWGFDTAKEQISTLQVRWMPKRGIWGVFERDYLGDRDPIKPTTAWTFKDVNSERGSEQFISLGFDKEVFPRPKPVGTLKRLIQIGCPGPGIVLDFFAGSGTTAEAMAELNGEDFQNRTFILVQLPETIDPDEDKIAHDFLTRLGLPTTVASITKERARRGLRKVGEASAEKIDQMKWMLMRRPMKEMQLPVKACATLASRSSNLPHQISRLGTRPPQRTLMS